MADAATATLVNDARSRLAAVVVRVPIPALLAAVVVLWLPPLACSLWRDEAGTFVIAKDGFTAIASAALKSTAHSPLYFWLVRASSSLGAPLEIGLRLPSLLSLVAAAFLLYRLAAQRAGREFGLLAALCFAAQPDVAFAAADARPYGLAVLALVASAWALSRLLETGRSSAAILYAIAAAATLHAHYLIGVGLAVPALLAFWEGRRAGRRRLRFQLYLAWAATAILLLPVVPQIQSLYRARALHSWAGVPSSEELILRLMPPALALCIVAGILGWRLLDVSWRPRFQGVLGSREVLFLTAWAWFGPLLLFAVSRLTGAVVFSGRYCLASAPALALLAACMIRSWNVTGARRLAALLVAAGSIALFTPSRHGNEDWRGAVAAINSIVDRAPAPVLFATPFVEGRALAHLHDPAIRPLLSAPLAPYPIRGEVILLPCRFTAEAASYLDGFIARGALRHGALLLFATGGEGYETWLSGRLWDHGLKPVNLGTFGRVHAIRFRRPGFGAN